MSALFMSATSLRGRSRNRRRSGAGEKVCRVKRNIVAEKPVNTSFRQTASARGRARSKTRQARALVIFLEVALDQLSSKTGILSALKHISSAAL
jgi:hypothetical protein